MELITTGITKVYYPQNLCSLMPEDTIHSFCVLNDADFEKHKALNKLEWFNEMQLVAICSVPHITPMMVKYYNIGNPKGYHFLALSAGTVCRCVLMHDATVETTNLEMGKKYILHETCIKKSELGEAVEPATFTVS